MSSFFDKIAHYLAGTQNSAAQNTTTFNGRKLADILPAVGNNTALAADVQPQMQPQVQPRVSFLPPVEAAPMVSGDDAPAAGLVPRDPNRAEPTFSGRADGMSFLPSVNAAPPPVDNGSLPTRTPVLPIVGQNPNLTPSQDTAAQIQAITGKQYGFEKNPDGSVKLDDFGNKVYAKDRATHHGLTDILKGIGNGALEGLAHSNGQGGLAGLLGSALGGAAGGGVAEGFDRNYNNKVADQRQLAKLGGQYQRESAIEDDQIGKNYKQAQITNINADNVRADNALKDKAATEAERQKTTRRNNFFRNHKTFDGANATDADRRELASFDETPESVGKYDLTNPVLRQSGGVTYRLNKQTGAFEDAGIPKDGSKAIVDYTVTDPNTGIDSTYSTTSEKAAQLKNNLAAQGLTIKAATERQNSQQTFAAGENQKNRDAAAERQQTANQMQVKLTELRHLQEMEKGETDFNRKKELQAQAAQAAQDLATLRSSFKDDKK